MNGFKATRKLGSGGFGEVWQVVRVIDGGVFAEKVLLQDDDDEAVARFKKEVRILQALDHPHIVKVIAAQLDAKPYGYVMPLYQGSVRSNFDDILNQPQRIKAVFDAVLNAMEYAHSHGVIHRDLKPDNVLMNDDSDIVVSDFGLGRLIDTKSTRLTQTGMGMGTPLYMPPEQVIDSKSTDARSDVFSLGRMLYELFTEQMSTAVQDLALLSKPVAKVVRKATRRRPDERYQSIAELREAIEAIPSNRVDRYPRYSFSNYFRPLLKALWNGGNDQEMAVRDIHGVAGPGAYGNHRKLSFAPWALLEDGSHTGHRRLTERGRAFVQQKIAVPHEIVFDEKAQDYVAVPGTPDEWY